MHGRCNSSCSQQLCSPRSRNRQKICQTSKQCFVPKWNAHNIMKLSLSFCALNNKLWLSILMRTIQHHQQFNLWAILKCLATDLLRQSRSTFQYSLKLCFSKAFTQGWLDAVCENDSEWKKRLVNCLHFVMAWTPHLSGETRRLSFEVQLLCESYSWARFSKGSQDVDGGLRMVVVPLP